MRFFRLAFIFLLLLRAATFFSTKPILKNGDLVKVSGILMEKPKTGFKTVAIKLNDRSIVFPLSQNARQKFNGEEMMFKRVSVAGIVRCYRRGGSDDPPAWRAGRRPAPTKIPINGARDCVVTSKRITVSSANFLTVTLRFFASIRQFVINTCFEIFPADEAGIMIGILLGESGFVSHNLYEAFKTSGVMHLFAASGMNLVIFGGFVRQSLILFINRKKAATLAAAAVIFYVFLSGFSASILRAAAMYLAVFSASIFGRPLKARRNLFYATATLIFVNPELIFNLGFQLSVLATMGLIAKPIGNGSSVNGNEARYGNIGNVFRLFRRCRLTFSPKRASLPIADVHDSQVYSLWKMLFSDFQTSLSAFLFTAPLIIFSFGQINLLAIVVNVLVLWTIDLLMIGGGILILLKAIGLGFVMPLAMLIFPIMQFFKQTVLFFSKLEFGVINLSWHGNTALFLIFCLTWWIGFLLKTEKRANW